MNEEGQRSKKSEEQLSEDAVRICVMLEKNNLMHMVHLFELKQLPIFQDQFTKNVIFISVEEEILKDVYDILSEYYGDKVMIQPSYRQIQENKYNYVIALGIENANIMNFGVERNHNL